MVSSGWMNRDEDGDSVRFFWVLNRPECTRGKKKQHARLISGWMNGDEDEGFCSFLLGAQQTRMHKRKKKTACKA
jgi:hypothetical protein